jgi:hypothetical protein
VLIESLAVLVLETLQTLFKRELGVALLMQAFELVKSLR